MENLKNVKSLGKKCFPVQSQKVYAGTIRTARRHGGASPALLRTLREHGRNRSMPPHILFDFGLKHLLTNIKNNPLRDYFLIILLFWTFAELEPA